MAALGPVASFFEMPIVHYLCYEVRILSNIVDVSIFS